jgi:hypothetical protein
MLLSELDRGHLEQLDKGDREQLFGRVSRDLTDQVLSAKDFDAEVERITDQLNHLGHELRLFDIDFDVDIEKGETSQLWCGDWERQNSSRLIITFHSCKGVELEWSQRPSQP